MNTTHAETIAPTGLPGLDALLHGGIRRRDSILIAAVESRQAIALTSQIAQSVATIAPVVCFGLPVAPAAHLHVCDDAISDQRRTYEALAYAAGSDKPHLAAFGLLERFPETHENLEENIEDIGLAILHTGDRRGFATIMTARLESGWPERPPLDALGIYDPMGGHAHLVLFIEPAWSAADETEVRIRILKWRFGPTGGAVAAKWDSRNRTFACPMPPAVEPPR